VSFLPVLAYDGANMTQIDAGGILDIAMAGTSATLLARKWESALLVNVDNDTLRRILDNPEALAAVEHRCPKLVGLLAASGRLDPHYLLSVDGQRFLGDLGEPLRPGERLLLLSADAGG